MTTQTSLQLGHTQSCTHQSSVNSFTEGLLWQRFIARKKKTLSHGYALIVCIAVFAVMSLNNGYIDAHLGHFWTLLWQEDLNANQQMQRYVLLEVRAPRVLLAMVVGMLLAMSGCVLQSMVRNPLADPGIIGITSGSAVAAAAVFIFAPLIPSIADWQIAASLSTQLITALSFLGQNLIFVAAFLGALLTLKLVLFLARTESGLSVTTLVLAGIAVNAFAGTLIGVMSYVADDDALRQITYWTMGSLAGVTWFKSLSVLILGCVAAILFLRYSNALNLLSLGESHARAMGMDVKRTTTSLLWLVALSVSLAVALCGAIGFVGLVVPHIARMLFGANQKVLLPVSGAMGALLLVLADMVSRNLVYPLEIPIGIVTSALGAPFFIYLIQSFKHRTN